MTRRDRASAPPPLTFLGKPRQETVDKKSDIDFHLVASDNNLSHARVYGGFKEKLEELKQGSTDCAILAFVKFEDASNKGHYVGINGTKQSDEIDYIEIAPTSTYNTQKASRRTSWNFDIDNSKVYVPFFEIKHLDVFTK